MTQNIDVLLAELLTSRLCHDLVGPVGAVNNGMELLEDDGMGMADDAFKLVVKSATQTSDLLQFYRLAYGLAGSRIGPDLTQVSGLCDKFLSHGKIALSWPAQPAPDELPEGAGKLLLNLVALAAECLPRGGEIAVRVGLGDSGVANALALEVAANGTDAGLREDLAASLSETAALEDLTPRNVQGYFTRYLAKSFGSDLSIDSAPQSGAHTNCRIE